MTSATGKPGDKPTYCPIPGRAMLDSRLSERHWRTLAVIAAHDRLGKNGIGCFASHERLAALIGCNYNRLSMNIRELGEMGYLERVVHPLNKRLRIYRVIYNEEDRTAMKGATKGNDGSPSGEQYPRDSSPTGEVIPPDSSPTQTPSDLEIIDESGVNILRETCNTSGRNHLIDPVETAPPSKNVGAMSPEEDTGRYLRKLEKALQAGNLEEPSRHLAALYALADKLDINDPLRGWAERLSYDDAFEGIEP